MDVQTRILIPPLQGDVDRKGHHVSGLIRGISLDLGMLKPRTPAEEESGLLWWALGWMWEQWAMEQLARKRVGELIPQLRVQLDGIQGTLDDWSPVTGEVVEYKFTSRSADKDIRDNWAWMAQVKAYCYMVGGNQARFFVCHVNGNWRPPEPRYLEHRIAFTDEELAENWSLLQNYRKKLDGEQEEGA